MISLSLGLSFVTENILRHGISIESTRKSFVPVKGTELLRFQALRGACSSSGDENRKNDCLVCNRIILLL